MPVRLAVPPRDWLRARPPAWELLRRPTAGESRQLRADVDQYFARHTGPSGALREPVDVEDVLSEVRRAVDVIRRLAICPLCPDVSGATFEPWDRETFHCRCSACDAQWGTRICGSCQRRFPVLWANSTATTSEGRYENGDEVDARFGSEILALPCPSFSDWTRFRCPWCEVCQGSPSCGCTNNSAGG